MPAKPPPLIGCVSCGAEMRQPYNEGCCRSCYISFHAANNLHRLTAAEWAFAESRQMIRSKKHKKQ